MSTLERAVAIAAEAHSGAKGKAGRPYILHPLRVMLAVKEPDEQIAAALHDVVEDTDWTINQLRLEGFSEIVLDAVDALTRRKGEDYFDYVSRAGADPVAKAVKLADLADNMNISRIPSPTEWDRNRVKMYKEAAAQLNAGDRYKSVEKEGDE